MIIIVLLHQMNVVRSYLYIYVHTHKIKKSMHLKSGKVLYFVYREKIRTYLDIKRRQFLGKGVDVFCKAIETGIISLIDQVAAAFLVKLTKVFDFGTTERFSINSINLSTNFKCCLVQHNCS